MIGRKSAFTAPYARFLAGCFAVLTLHTASSQEVKTLEDVFAVVAQKSMNLSSWTSEMSMDMNLKGTELSYSGKTYNKGASSLTSITVSIMGKRAAVKTVIGPDHVQWNETMAGGKRDISMLDMSKAAEAAGVDPEMLKATMGQGPGSPININLTGKEMLDEYGLTYDLRFVGQETVGDTPVFAIEGIIYADVKDRPGRSGPLGSAGITANKIRLSLGVEDGFLRAMQLIDGQGTTILSLTYTNVVLNPSLDDRMFQFVPPPGSTVTDMTPLTIERIKKDRLIEEGNTP